MNFERAIDRILGGEPGIDAALAETVRELVDVGEPDLAIVTLVENSLRDIPVDIIDEMEQHFTDSGEYVEREALNAVAKYRQLVTA